MPIEGTVVAGLGIAHKLFGIPTANIAPAVAADVPSPGTYVAHVTIDQQQYDGALYVGPDGKVEVHLFGFDGELTGKHATVIVGERVADYVSWESEQQMRKKVLDDIALVQAALQRM